MLANIIGSFIAILIGYSLVPHLNQYGYGLGWIVFGIMSTIAAISVIINIKYVLYSNDYDTQPETVKKKKHKQTYSEYVKERLAVEKLMRYN
jgi:uncharacterized membrane protein